MDVFSNLTVIFVFCWHVFEFFFCINKIRPATVFMFCHSSLTVLGVDRSGEKSENKQLLYYSRAFISLFTSSASQILVFYLP